MRENIAELKSLADWFGLRSLLICALFYTALPLLQAAVENGLLSGQGVGGKGPWLAAALLAEAVVAFACGARVVAAGGFVSYVLAETFLLVGTLIAS